MKESLLVAVLSAYWLGACSKGTVEVNTAPTMPLPQQQRIDRIVEIDRLLSAPVTGDPADSDRRVALRAERAALTGNPNPAVFANRPAPVPTNIVRTPTSAGVNYAAPTPLRPANGIVVAPNSQATNLSFLEQMTPSERERYYRDLRLRNAQSVDIRVRRQ